VNEAVAVAVLIPVATVVSSPLVGKVPALNVPYVNEGNVPALNVSAA